MAKERQRLATIQVSPLEIKGREGSDAVVGVSYHSAGLSGHPVDIGEKLRNRRPQERRRPVDQRPRRPEANHVINASYLANTNQYFSLQYFNIYKFWDDIPAGIKDRKCSFNSSALNADSMLTRDLPLKRQ